MKEKIKTIALQVLSIIISMALCLGTWGLGFFLAFKGYIGSNRSAWLAVSIVCAVAVISSAVVNIVGKKLLLKKFSAMKIREFYDFAEILKSNTESNFKLAEKRVRTTLALAYSYIVAVILILLLCSFCVGVQLIGMEVTTPILIILIFLTWGLVDVFCTPLVNSAPPAAYLLEESRFPLVYSTVREAAERSGCRLNVKIYCYGNGASVTVCKRTAIICINYLYGALFTRSELFNIMLHEFAHIVNKDVKRSRAFARAQQRLEDNGRNSFISFSKMLLLPLPSAAVDFKVEVYNTFANRHHEIEADKALKTLGDPQESINALAKTKMVELFGSVPHRELDYDFFASENLTGDYAAQELALFLKERELRGEEWRELIEKELPAKVDTHPTFRNRMVALGCDNYNPYSIETDTAYIAEQREIIAAADREMNEENATDYATLRENAYINRKKVIDEYDETVKSGKEIPDNKMYEYMQAFLGVDDDIVLKLANSAATLPNPTIANYYRANVLFNRNDDRCVDYLKEIAANTDDMEVALGATSRIGEYALKTGNEALLKEYRSTAPDIVQASRDKGERTRIIKSSNVEKCHIENDVISKIIDEIDKEILRAVSAIYIGTHTDSDGKKHYPVAVCLKGRNRTANFEILQSLNDYFFNFNVRYDFIILPPKTPGFRKVKDCGSCVYENK